MSLQRPIGRPQRLEHKAHQDPTIIRWVNEQADRGGYHYLMHRPQLTELPPSLQFLGEPPQPSFAERLVQQSIEAMIGKPHYREPAPIPDQDQPVTWRAEMTAKNLEREEP